MDRRGGEGKSSGVPSLRRRRTICALLGPKRGLPKVFREIAARIRPARSDRRGGAGKFLRIILEKFAKGAIGREHDAMLVDADDGVGRVGDNGGQLLGRLLAAKQFGLVQGARFRRERRRCGSRPGAPSSVAPQRKIEIDGERRARLRPSSTKISSTVHPRAKACVRLAKNCAVGAQQIGQTLFFDEFLGRRIRSSRERRGWPAG